MLGLRLFAMLIIQGLDRLHLSDMLLVCVMRGDLACNLFGPVLQKLSKNTFADDDTIKTCVDYFRRVRCSWEDSVMAKSTQHHF